MQELMEIKYRSSAKPRGIGVSTRISNTIAARANLPEIGHAHRFLPAPASHTRQRRPAFASRRRIRAQAGGIAVTAAPASLGLADPFHPDPRGALGAVMGEAVVTIDDQQRVVMINPAALRMFGCSAAEALGSDLSRFIPVRLQAAHARLVQGFLASEAHELSALDRRPIVGLRANGEEFPLEATISRIEAAGEFGARRFCTALLRDLSHQPTALASIELLTARVRSIFNLAPTAIWIAEGERIVFANQACASLFGTQDPQLLVGQSIYALLAPESHGAMQRSMTQVLRAETPLSRVNERIARLDGAVRDVEIAVAAMPDHGRTTLQMVINDVTEQSRANRELQRSRRELRQLTASLVDAREEERRRIARELHDELGQRLTALKLELSTLDERSPSGRPAPRVAAMFDMIDETVAAVRRIATDLRPAMLDDLGLNTAIEWLARESARRMGVTITLSLPTADPPIGEAASIALYRMAQETLTNIARHARATEVRIDLQCDPDGVLLQVQDNGVGLPKAATKRRVSHGLMGMRERCQMLGGTIEVGNAPEGGVRITIRLPLQQPVEDTEPGELDSPSIVSGAAGHGADVATSGGVGI